VGCRATLPGTGTPSLGFNIGSNVGGIFQFSGHNLYSKDYPSAFGCANGLGKLCGITLTDSEFIDGTIGFAGGITENKVDYGYNSNMPDVHQSLFKNCKITFTKNSTCGLILNAGPEEKDRILGRENITLDGCEVNYVDTPIYGIGLFGNLTGNVVVKNCRLNGMGGIPQQGDISISNNNANLPNDNISNYTFTNNSVDSGRPIIIKKMGVVI